MGGPRRSRSTAAGVALDQPDRRRLRADRAARCARAHATANPAAARRSPTRRACGRSSRVRAVGAGTCRPTSSATSRRQVRRHDQADDGGGVSAATEPAVAKTWSTAARAATEPAKAIAAKRPTSTPRPRGGPANPRAGGRGRASRWSRSSDPEGSPNALVGASSARRSALDDDGAHRRRGCWRPRVAARHQGDGGRARVSRAAASSSDGRGSGTIRKPLMAARCAGSPRWRLRAMSCDVDRRPARTRRSAGPSAHRRDAARHAQDTTPSARRGRCDCDRTLISTPAAARPRACRHTETTLKSALALAAQIARMPPLAVTAAKRGDQRVRRD